MVGWTHRNRAYRQQCTCRCHESAPSDVVGIIIFFTITVGVLLALVYTNEHRMNFQQETIPHPHKVQRKLLTTTTNVGTTSIPAP